MIDEPIRIAFVLHVMQVAGAEVLVAEIIRRLGGRLDPVVLCLDGIGQLGETMRKEGVAVVGLGRRPGLDVRVAGRLASQLRHRQIQVVHAHQYTPFFYSALARVAVQHPMQLMFTEHGRHYPDVVSGKRRLANRLVLGRLADRITAVCEFSARSLREIDGFSARTIEVIENGIDVPAPSPESQNVLRGSLDLSPDRRYIVCVARFHPVKDHDTLLRAFAIVAGRRPDTDLLLAGDGPLRGELERKTREMGLAARVHFLGVRHDVPALLRASDVFALTSVSEAASLTLLEAMAAALPVVVTEVGGNPEIVRHGIDGVLVPRGDTQAIAGALLEIVADPSRAAGMAAAARARVQERYRLDDTVQAYHTRYLDAVDELR